MYTCKNCLTKFNHRASYEKHWAERHQTWSCPECELDPARQKKTIYNHMKKCHKRSSRLPRPEPMRRPRITTTNEYNEEGKKKRRLEEESRPSTSRDNPRPPHPTEAPRQSASTGSAESDTTQNSITLRLNIVLGRQESPDRGSPSPIMIDEEEEDPPTHHNPARSPTPRRSPTPPTPGRSPLRMEGIGSDQETATERASPAKTNRGKSTRSESTTEETDSTGPPPPAGFGQTIHGISRTRRTDGSSGTTSATRESVRTGNRGGLSHPVKV